MTKEELLMPRYRFKSVIDITADDLKRIGAEAIALDIDNTIAPDGKFKYLSGAKEWVKSMQASGFKVTLVTNGTLIRVLPVSRHLDNLPFVHLSRKPSPRGLIKAAKMMNVEISKLAVIGDQLFSDIKAANRCGAIPIRTDPMPEKSLYPNYYKWKAKREKPYLDKFEETHGYGI